MGRFSSFPLWKSRTGRLRLISIWPQPTPARLRKHRKIIHPQEIDPSNFLFSIKTSKLDFLREQGSPGFGSYSDFARSQASREWPRFFSPSLFLARELKNNRFSDHRGRQNLHDVLSIPVPRGFHNGGHLVPSPREISDPQGKSTSPSQYQSRQTWL